jgi:ribosomal protein L37E
MELKLIKNNGYTLGERWKLLLGNTLLCRHCGGKLWWSGEIVDFNILGFDHKNQAIICFKCGKVSYYDMQELENHEVNFVSFWAEG